jgi:hypothetical protein
LEYPCFSIGDRQKIQFWLKVNVTVRPESGSRSSFANVRKIDITGCWVYRSRLGCLIMKPSFKADKFCNPKSSLNGKKPGYFKVSAGFRFALFSLRPCFLFFPRFSIPNDYFRNTLSSGFVPSRMGRLRNIICRKPLPSEKRQQWPRQHCRNKRHDHQHRKQARR